jgi:proteic killer suppression protein
MIHSFSCKETEDLFNSKSSRRFRGFERIARRKLLQIHAATNLLDLRIPPGNMLECLQGRRKGQHSIRINGQWRICFVWKEDGAHKVEIVDYH